MNDLTISFKQLTMIKHCLGLNKSPEHNRNYYNIYPGCIGYDLWVDLEKKGLAKETHKHIFKCTDKLLKYMEVKRK